MATGTTTSTDTQILILNLQLPEWWALQTDGR